MDGRGRSDGIPAEFVPYAVHGLFQLLQLVPAGGGAGGEQIELLACLALLHQGLGGEGEGAHGGVLPPGGADEFHSRLGQLTGHIGGGAQPFLAADVLEIGVADGHLEGGALEAVAPQADSHLVG